MAPRTRSTGDQALTAGQVAAFRLDRHHLLGRARASVVSICRDVCGVQAQVMSAAELALWTRRPDVDRSDVRAALWRTRTLVKTSCMRITLHLIPADEHSLYVAALRRSRSAAVSRILARLRVRPDDVTAMNALIVDALAGGPLTQQDLTARARAHAGRRLQAWIDRMWSITRPAIVEGLICYGPPRGSEVTYVRTDQWLGRQVEPDEDAAKATLLRRFLAAYGPATARDFAKWSGMPTGEAQAAWTAAAAGLRAVSVEGETASVHRDDLAALLRQPPEAAPVRLLPSFDPFLLAHASKDHLVERRHYKRVYRNQGWLSPVVLQGGRIAGVWRMETAGSGATLTVEPFARPGRALESGLDEEAARLARFLDMPVRLRVTRAAPAASSGTPSAARRP